MDLDILSKEDLYNLQKEISTAISKKKKIEEEEYRKETSTYIGRYFYHEASSYKSVIKVINTGIDSEYRMYCLKVNLNTSVEEDLMIYDDIGLFCNSLIPGCRKVIDEYIEISETEFLMYISNMLSTVLNRELSLYVGEKQEKD